MTQEEYFDAVYLEMYDMLLAYAESSLRHQKALAEEAVQDTFRIFWIAIQNEKEMPNPRGWLVNTLKKYSLQGTTQGNGLTGGLPPVRFSM